RNRKLDLSILLNNQYHNLLQKEGYEGIFNRIQASSKNFQEVLIPSSLMEKLNQEEIEDLKKLIVDKDIEIIINVAFNESANNSEKELLEEIFQKLDLQVEEEVVETSTLREIEKNLFSLNTGLKRSEIQELVLFIE